MNTMMAMLAALTVCGSTVKKVPVFAPNEEMVFEIEVRGAVSNELDGCALEWKRTGDDGRTETGKAKAAEKFIYRTSLDRPGFVWLVVNLVDGAGKPVLGPHSSARRKGRRVAVHGSFGAGVDILSIKPAVAAPKDLAEFWARHRANLAAVEWKGLETLKKIDSPTKGVDLYEFSIPCAGGRPATGHLAVPTKPGKYPATARFWGYNQSWSKGVISPPDKVSAKQISMYVSAHGFEMGRDEKYYQDFHNSVKSNGYGHAFDPEQNKDPETAYFAGMTYRLMRALEYLKSRPEWNGHDLVVTGASQGGLQSIWAAALVEGVSECSPGIPWGCDLGFTTIGRNGGPWHIPWVPALAYYDTCSLAKLIPSTCRVNISAGLGDYTCPPSGVMAFYNSITAAPKRLRFSQNSGHGSRYQSDPLTFVIEGGKIED